MYFFWKIPILTLGPSHPGSSKAEIRRLWHRGTRTSSLLSFNKEDCISQREGISEESESKMFRTTLIMGWKYSRNKEVKQVPHCNFYFVALPEFLILGSNSPVETFERHALLILKPLVTSYPCPPPNLCKSWKSPGNQIQLSFRELKFSRNLHVHYVIKHSMSFYISTRNLVIWHHFVIHTSLGSSLGSPSSWNLLELFSVVSSSTHWPHFVKKPTGELFSLLTWPTAARYS